ncbi:MAG: tyrosine-protein phosphatase [Planctomycetota bacterium]|jgi:protein tyrosine/serine phosphatase|nr:tyrosine-protein phosphatase [Planctomycetota bacterium]
MDEPKSADIPAKRSSKRIWHVAAMVLLIGGGIWLWEEVIEDRVIPKRWGVVEPGSIYRSGRLSSALVKRMLTEHQMQVIVALEGEKAADPDQRAEIQAAEELGIELKRFPLRGNGTGDVERYADAVAAVVEAQRAQKPVLVHCSAGTQRTGGIIAFYRLLVQQRSPSVVLEEMTQYDYDPDDNPALLAYINENMGRMAVLLQARGIIGQVPDPLPVLSIAK